MTKPKTLNYDKTVTIAKDASLSAAVDLEDGRLVGFICPAAIEATTVRLGFKASPTLTGTYNDVTIDGAEAFLTFAVDDYALVGANFGAYVFGFRFLKIEAQTVAGAAVAQATAARVFTVIRQI